ncbi:hypothetical protein CDEST_03125 [Colletotrichum destructivum]|uniref:Uncharacterized protein n=1 Tax=Colletotrichum destructivum TaxID=34406 RepID=A0AAX4I3Y8_9PEZI|nr:hypothetical protein CDEST_03125 [Colletotrichum destructivum]
MLVWGNRCIGLLRLSSPDTGEPPTPPAGRQHAGSLRLWSLVDGGRSHTGEEGGAGG